MPRDQIEEANALTNHDYAAFDPRARVDVGLESIPWLILPRMLTVSEDIYKDLKEKRAQVKDLAGAARARTRPEDKLRVRERW